MDFAVDISCEMKVNRNCDLCRQKVTELMHSVHVVYSVDFVGGDNSIKLKGRANPNLILAIIERYGEHGKLSNFRIEGEIVNARGGAYYTESGYYLPSPAAANYPYPSSYAPPPPHFFAGNSAYPMSNPPCKTETPRRGNSQHTAAPPFNCAPPPPRPLYSYSYVEPPYWPSSSSSGGGRCVIM